MKKSRIFAVMFILAGILSGLTGCTKDDNSVSGKITYKDKITGEEKVADAATVYLMTGENEYLQKVQTDANGEYQFYPVPDGEYFVEAELSTLLFDYTGKSESFAVKGKEDAQVNVVMTNSENVITGTATIIINGEEYVSQDVVVYIYNAGSDTYLKKTNCDENGNFYFDGLSDGSYDIDAEYTDDDGTDYYGYKDNISVTGGEVVSADLTLEALKK